MGISTMDEAIEKLKSMSDGQLQKAIETISLRNAENKAPEDD